MIKYKVNDIILLETYLLSGNLELIRWDDSGDRIPTKRFIIAKIVKIEPNWTKVLVPKGIYGYSSDPDGGTWGIRDNKLLGKIKTNIKIVCKLCRKGDYNGNKRIIPNCN